MTTISHKCEIVVIIEFANTINTGNKLDFDVALVTPVCAPCVPNKDILNTVFNTIGYSIHCVV